MAEGTAALSEFLTLNVFRPEEDDASTWKCKDKASAMIAELCQIFEPTKNRSDDDLTVPLFSPFSSHDTEQSDTEYAIECNEENDNYFFVDGLEYELEEDDDMSNYGGKVYGTETSPVRLTKEPQTLTEILWSMWCRGLRPGAQGSFEGRG